MWNDSELIPYKGAWISETFDGWSALYEGYVYSASSLDGLKDKLNSVMSDHSVFQPLYKQAPKVIVEAEEEYSDGEVITQDGDPWAVQIRLADGEYDDSFDGEQLEEITVYAYDIADATKYAQQYVFKKANTDESWVDAEIVSVVQK